MHDLKPGLRGHKLKQSRRKIPQDIQQIDMKFEFYSPD